jgi:ubiquinone biosynthesis protein
MAAGSRGEQPPLLRPLGARRGPPVKPSRIEIERLPLPEVGLGQTLGRLLVWGAAGLRFAWSHLGDRLRGDDAPEQLAVRVRELFEQVGGTALKLGQQLSVRADLLPFEVCNELGTQLDAVPPIPVDEARALVEAELGRPVDDVFSAFGTRLLGSASIAVVYEAELVGGGAVAVKIRRPDVAARILADMAVMDLFTGLAESLTLVRPGHFRHIRADLRNMLTDELDLRKEADFQVRFRELAERDRLKWLTAPRVHGALSTDGLLVSELVHGVSAAQIVAALDAGDTAQLAAWAEQGIDPVRLGRRVFELSQWSRLECPFFQADPHPGNLIVQADSTLVVLDFGSCGATSRELRAQLVELSRRVLDEDFHGAAAMSLAMLSPLPYIDLEAMRYRLELALWRANLPSLVEGAAWWERTSIGLWLSIVEVTADFQIPGNVDMLRGVRATLLYDTLACRLHPELDRPAEIRRWYRRAAKRMRRRVEAEVDARGEEVEEREWFVLGAELEELLDKGRYTVAHLARHATPDFRALQDAVGYAVAQLLRLLVTGGVILTVVGAGATSWFAATGRRVPVAEIAQAIVTHPLTWALGGLLVFVWYRRVQYRLTFREPGRG